MKAHVILISACLMHVASCFAPTQSALSSSVASPIDAFTKNIDCCAFSTWTSNTPTTARSSVTELFETKPKVKGVYSRPSAAIERGSGFYVPGLEGSKVRILFGILVLLLSYVNTLLGLGDSNMEAVEFSQKTVTFYGTLLLLQGLVEAAKEAGLGLDLGTKKDGKDANSSSASSAGAKQLSQLVNGSLRSDEAMAEKVKWVAATYVALTSATHVLLLDDDGVDCDKLYSLGDAMNEVPADTERDGVQAALDTVYKSKGGRVSVPDSHKCAVLLPEDNRRCILLQKVNVDGRRRCLMIGSNQLLVAFTKNDLKWLGSLGEHISYQNNI